MKISVRCEDPFNVVLCQQMYQEGDLIVDEGAELVVTDREPPLDGVPFVRIGGRMPRAVLETLDYDPDVKPICYLSKWFDRFNLWSDQLIVSVPLMGLMDEGKGAVVCTGTALRYIDESPLKDRFDDELLTEILKQQGHTGFVSLGIDSEGAPHSVEFGIPCYGNLVVLEGCRQRLSEFFTNPSRLLESWAVGLLITRYPFPLKQSASRAFIEGLSRSMRKHLRTPFVTEHRHSFYTDSTIIALATTWDNRLIDANKRAVSLARTLKVEEKQYRTDLNTATQEKWALLQNNNLILPNDRKPSSHLSKTLSPHLQSASGLTHLTPERSTGERTPVGGPPESNPPACE